MSYKSTIHDEQSRKSEIYKALIEYVPVSPTSNSQGLNLKFLSLTTRNSIRELLSESLNENKAKIIVLQRQYDDAQYQRDLAYGNSSSVITLIIY